MKKKNFNKKLVLNKETVAHLETQEMDNLRGGTYNPVVCLTPPITNYITVEFSCYETLCDNNETCPVCN